MGQHMTLASERTYHSHTYVYQAQCCQGCPLRGKCRKAKGDRSIEANHTLWRYKRKTRERLACEEGLRYRLQRPVEPETVFGQMKADKNYIRSRHFGKDKIIMDFASSAIAFNIGKM
jgi:hypothetical protein